MESDRKKAENTALFTGRASAYEKGRPSYAAALIDHLYREEGFSERSVIADIGSGTGIFSNLLLERGSTVYGVEPNADMREAARKRFEGCGRFIRYDGTASHTGLPDHSVDFVTAAQAFHWFDPAEFKAECRRILKPGGKIFLIWNIRDEEDPVNKEWFSVLRNHCPKFKGPNGGFRPEDGRIDAFFDGTYDRLAFDNPLVYDTEEKFVSRCLSGSYALREEDTGYAAFVKALKALYAAFAADGVLLVQNETVVYAGIV
ncbi:MAG: class I SAM-dependent methyltransferase [Lachnospiraceae bacterium]|nr:class I SAM-dependent methyltransferase [Lachnospiraceae bacterium]